jgi:hypothetical protein
MTKSNKHANQRKQSGNMNVGEISFSFILQNCVSHKCLLIRWLYVLEVPSDIVVNSMW